MAQALARMPDVVCIDEFCAPLDEPLTRAICLSLARRSLTTSLLVATSRPRLASALRPDVILTCVRRTLEISTSRGNTIP
jgi:ABC-type ATPase with predicted acetyltransferase domain